MEKKSSQKKMPLITRERLARVIYRTMRAETKEATKTAAQQIAKTIKIPRGK